MVFRQTILKNNFQLTTSEVMLRTANPTNIRCLEHWRDSKNWVAEWAANRARACFLMEYSARNLSGRLTGVIGVRGNSGTGKTRCLQGYVKDLRGILNPDELKAHLKCMVESKVALLNHQVHEEGSELCKMLLKTF